MKKVGVIGGYGFIESDIISLFLNQNFDVKISTADITLKENYQHLMELKHSQNLYVCEIDISIKSSLHNFIKDCDVILYINPSDI